ncbi:hypothetical protein ABIF29_007254 [Bradyrhizobium elkanii]|uniref:Uncharacterized protein n=1 Tax=Bradyrhizobium elkanii TaxID=29448 RepID=A0ABV4FAG6_BRAEL|nr:hypothetical protein [Bradyrhizobium elkanii]MCP1977797.1 hypothetical protein [Bradyrhizobium elkanii]MCS3887685.1 hypothetical protein [Bradyrhizobium elkanii]MCS4213296.1 hypothetical protein [Bradyrhizobium elkanii]MCW2213602.1 hypothetical protein [Bradyrhizobium elkanii]
MIVGPNTGTLVIHSSLNQPQFATIAILPRECNRVTLAEQLTQSEKEECRAWAFWGMQAPKHFRHRSCAMKIGRNCKDAERLPSKLLLVYATCRPQGPERLEEFRRTYETCGEEISVG